MNQHTQDKEIATNNFKALVSTRLKKESSPRFGFFLFVLRLYVIYIYIFITKQHTLFQLHSLISQLFQGYFVPKSPLDAVAKNAE